MLIYTKRKEKKKKFAYIIKLAIGLKIIEILFFGILG